MYRSCGFFLTLFVVLLPASTFADDPKPVHPHGRFVPSPGEARDLSDRSRRLVKQLGSENFAERQAASKALDTIGELALPALYEAIETEDVEIRRRAAKLLQRINSRLRNSALLDEVNASDPILRDRSTDPAQRREVAARLSFLARGVPGLYQRLCAGLSDPDEEVRFQCALGLTSFSERPSWLPGIKDIVKGLKDASPRVRVECVRALGQALAEAAAVGSEVPTPVLAAMKDPDNKVRRRATAAVGAMTNRPDLAVPALLEAALHDADNEQGLRDVPVRQSALFLLGDFGAAPETRQTVPILMEIAKRDSVDGRLAMGTLAKIRYEREKTYALFMDILKNGHDEGLRTHAIHCLEIMGEAGKAAYPTLMALLESDQGDQPYRTAELISAVGTLGPHDQRYVQALARVCKLNEKTAYEPLRTRQDASAHSALRMALRQLADVGPSARSALPTLVGLLNARPEQHYFYDLEADLTAPFKGIGAAAVDALCANLKTARGNPRVRTIRVLGGIGPAAKAALPALQAIAEATVPSDEQHIAAQDAIRRINAEKSEKAVGKSDRPAR
jgi:HEAT repeat protein